MKTKRVSSRRLQREPGPPVRSRRPVGSVWWTVPVADIGRSRVRATSDIDQPPTFRRGRGDLLLLATVAVLVALGVLMVFDVTYFYGQERYGDPLRFFRRHVLAILVGIGVFVVTSRVSLASYRRAALPGLGLALLGAVLVLTPLGSVSGGARRWFQVAGISVQPSEILKLAIVLYLAWSLNRRRDRLGEFRDGVLPPLIIVAVAAGLLLLEPDFGTVVLLGCVLIVMLFVAGIPLRLLLLVCGVAAPVAIFFLATVEYRKARVMSFLDPWSDPQNAGFQLIQSFIAFGSGGIGGLGLGQSRQKMFYLPAAHTDFVFSVVGEEIGLVGSLALLVTFGVFGFRGVRIALRHADPFGRLFAFGLTTLLVLQALVNMAVVMGLLPTKGLPLPFVSYGGSAMVVAMASVGILYGLSRETG